jgi:hypothetical protein
MGGRGSDGLREMPRIPVSPRARELVRFITNWYHKLLRSAEVSAYGRSRLVSVSL